MSYDFMRLLKRMAELISPKEIGITGLAFLPDHPESPNCWHLTVSWADSSSLRYGFAYDKPTRSKKGTMMAAYEAAGACLLELELEKADQ